MSTIEASISSEDAGYGTEQQRADLDPLSAPVLVWGPAPVLRGLAREWALRDALGTGTVLDLQESLHRLELARVRQPVQFAFNINVAATSPDLTRVDVTRPDIPMYDPPGAA